MAYFLSPVGNNSQVGTNGAPLSGGSITTYQAGTSTPVATYTDSSGSTPQQNPITLNPYGLPASPIWLLGGQAVKFVIKDAAGNLVRTIDTLNGINDATGRLLNVQVFTASGTYTPTPGARSIIVDGCGGGGAGGGIPGVGAGAAVAAGGGASGSFGRFSQTNPVATTVTVGAGGAGAANAAGGNGGTTSFGAIASFPGGGGAPVGVASTSASVSGSPGNVASAPVGANIFASQGIAGPVSGILLSASSALSGGGGSSPYGTPGGPIGQNGGTSAVAGGAASGRGAGGGGAVGVANATSAAGGNGSAGILIVYEYA